MSPESLFSQGSVLLISCYELGHPPMGVASPAAFLRRAGFDPVCVDTSVQRIEPDAIRRARFAAISVPMHTALRLGVLIAARIRDLNPECHICFFGLYAALNAQYLLSRFCDSVIGGEYEEPIVNLASSLQAGQGVKVPGVASLGDPVVPYLQRLAFPPADFSTLPPLQSYAHLQDGDDLLPAGYVEASRGCRHLCSHCPIPPVYGGRFFVVPRDIVLEEVRRAAEQGARHITFGDPDFLNGPGHSRKIVRAMHEEFPGLTFDFTAKVEHLLRHRRLLPELAACGCIFIVSALESLSDVVLGKLHKGHTRADFLSVLHGVRDAGIRLRPTLVPFTPWSTLDDYIELLTVIEAEGLVEAVDSVQYAIRLLVPPGSSLLLEDSMQRHLRGLTAGKLSYEWVHPDVRMDRLHSEVSTAVESGVANGWDQGRAFLRVKQLALAAARGLDPGSVAVTPPPFVSRPLRLTEPWFC